MGWALALGAMLAIVAVVFVARPFLRDPAPASDRLDELAPEARERLALAEERSVYGPPGAATTAPLREALGAVRRGLLGTVSRRQRLLAALWPASTVGAAAEWVTAHLPRRPRSA